MPTELEGFEAFESWAYLLAWVELESVVYYKAPLDLMPRRIRAERRGEIVRVTPLYGADFDPFDADEGHMPRFLRLDQAPSSDVDVPEPPTLREARS